MDQVVSAPREKPLKAPFVGPLAARLSRMLGQELADAVAPFGLAPAQFLVLRELWKRDGLSQMDLARRLDVEQSTMANTLKRMMRDGLIRREPRPDDARSSLVRVTQRAKDMEGPAKAAAKAMNARALECLSRKEQKRFVEMAERMIAALETK